MGPGGPDGPGVLARSVLAILGSWPWGPGGPGGPGAWDLGTWKSRTDIDLTSQGFSFLHYHRTVNMASKRTREDPDDNNAGLTKKVAFKSTTEPVSPPHSDDDDDDDVQEEDNLEEYWLCEECGEDFIDPFLMAPGVIAKKSTPFLRKTHKKRQLLCELCDNTFYALYKYLGQGDNVE